MSDETDEPRERRLRSAEAERRQRASALRDEVARLAADETDRAARERVMADMDAAGLDWPE